MKKKVLQIVMCVMPVLCLYGCGVFIPLGETDVLKLSESTSYYSNYVSENEDMIFRVKGRVHLQETNASVVSFTAEKDSDIIVQGDVERADAGVKLVYASPDGTQTVLVEGEDQEIDETLTVSKGEGVIYFEGEGNCDFRLKVKAGIGVEFGSQAE